MQGGKVTGSPKLQTKKAAWDPPMLKKKHAKWEETVQQQSRFTDCGSTQKSGGTKKKPTRRTTEQLKRTELCSLKGGGNFAEERKSSKRVTQKGGTKKRGVEKNTRREGDESRWMTTEKKFLKKNGTQQSMDRLVSWGGHCHGGKGGGQGPFRARVLYRGPSCG